MEPNLTTQATRDLPPLMMRAVIRPRKINDEDRTAEITWTTGARVLRGFFSPYYEELSLDKKHVRMKRLNNGAPLLDTHAAHSVRSVIGVVESATINPDGKSGSAVVRFAKAEDDPEADAIFRKVKDGIIQNVSVGYRVFKLEKIEESSDKVPVYRAVDWEPYELSVVPAGADDGAGFRSAEKEASNPCVFVTQSTQERAMENENPVTTPTQPAVTTPAPTPAPVVVDNTRATEDATRLERERGIAIRTLGTRHGLEAAFVDDLIVRGVNIDAARAAILDQLASRSAGITTTQHVQIEAGEDASDKFARAIEANLIVRSMLGDMVQQAAKKPAVEEQLRGISLDAGEYRNFKIRDIARECLERQGKKTRGLSDMDLIGLALTTRANTTADFPVLLESTIRKVMLAAFATQPDSWREFCAVMSVPDFRDTTFYRNGSFGTLDDVNEHGEFKRKNIPDGEKSKISVATKGNIIGITRKALVNDDMNAFTSLAQRFGRAAGLTIESMVWNLLQSGAGLGPTMGDTKTVFHADHNNIGTAAAITVDALEADAVLMSKQKDVSGNEYLDLQPQILIVPVGLRGTAKVLNAAEFDVSVTSKFQVPNKVRGLFSKIVASPRLTSTTRRWLLADPNLAPVFAVAFLDGQQAPVLEQQQGWTVDGTEYKVRLDVGVGAVDYRGGVTNAGT